MIFSLEIDGGVHAADLWTATSCDPKSIVNARVKIVQVLKCWTADEDEGNKDCKEVKKKDFEDCGQAIQVCF